MTRIIALDGHPNLQKRGSLRLGQTLRETSGGDLGGP